MSTSASEMEMQYPADLDVELPEQSSRLLAVLALVGIKLLLGIPHLIVLFIYGLVAGIVGWIAQWAVLFTGKYPAGMFDFVLGYLRWSWRYSVWYAGLADGYPPFSGGLDDQYPASADCAAPESSGRLLAVLRILALTLILVIPHIIVLVVLSFVVNILVWLAQWAILFTGRFPQGLAPLTVGTNRWNHRVNCYLNGLVDGYPPFSLG
jgi:hypothetical protein